MHPSFGTTRIVGSLQGALGLPHRDGVEVQGVMIAGLERLDLHMLLGDPGKDAFDSQIRQVAMLPGHTRTR